MQINIFSCVLNFWVNWLLINDEAERCRKHICLVFRLC